MYTIRVLCGLEKPAYLSDPASAQEMCLPGLLADIKQRLTLPTLPPGRAVRLIKCARPICSVGSNVWFYRGLPVFDNLVRLQQGAFCFSLAWHTSPWLDSLCIDSNSLLRCVWMLRCVTDPSNLHPPTEPKSPKFGVPWPSHAQGVELPSVTEVSPKAFNNAFAGLVGQNCAVKRCFGKFTCWLEMC